MRLRDLFSDDATIGPQADAVEGMAEDARVGLARPGPRRRHLRVDQIAQADLLDRFSEVPVPVRANAQAQAASPQLGEHVRDLGVGLEHP